MGASKVEKLTPKNVAKDLKVSNKSEKSPRYSVVSGVDGYTVNVELRPLSRKKAGVIRNSSKRVHSEISVRAIRKGSVSIAGKSQIKVKKEDPIIVAIKENNALFDQRPVIDFSGMKYDL